MNQHCVPTALEGDLSGASAAPARVSGPGVTVSVQAARAARKGRGRSSSPTVEGNGVPNTWFSAAQMSREAARALFDYRDGRLYWRDPIGRRRPEAGNEIYRKTIDDGPIWTVQLGSRSSVTRHMRRYLVWNWHFGGTDRVLLPINGDTLNDRIDNIRLGDPLPGVTVSPTPAALAPPVETGVTCPCCGQPAPVLSPNLIARAYRLPPQQEAILTRVWEGKGKPVTLDAIIHAMYADDPDGGPEYETARKYVKTQRCLLRQAIRGSGVDIAPGAYQTGYRIVLGPRTADAEAIDDLPDDILAAEAAKPMPRSRPQVERRQPEARKAGPARRRKSPAGSVSPRLEVVMGVLATGAASVQALATELAAKGFANTHAAVHFSLFELRRHGFAIERHQGLYRLDDAAKARWLSMRAGATMEAAE